MERARGLNRIGFELSRDCGMLSYMVSEFPFGRASILEIILLTAKMVLHRIQESYMHYATESTFQFS